MAGNYEKSMYNQLMDVMSRHDSFEEKYKQGIAEGKEENKVLKKENRSEVIYGEQATQNAVWNIWKKNCLTKE